MRKISVQSMKKVQHQASENSEAKTPAKDLCFIFTKVKLEIRFITKTVSITVLTFSE